MKITDLSVDNRTTVFILTFIILVMGVISYISLPREASPDVQIPLVIVSTPYFGVSPEDVESLITQPLEKELNEIAEVEEITSSSFEGYSLIRVEFQSGYDIDDALQKVRDKVEKAEPELPDEVDKPEIIEINFSEFPILSYVISGPQGLVTLKDIADDMKDDIENIPGVLDVTISGGLEREVKVGVDAQKLIHYNIRFADVIEAIQNENRTIPGGSIDVNTKSFLVRIPGEFEEPYIISDLIVKKVDDKPIYVKDIAEVEYSFKDRTSYSRLNGQAGVTVSVSKRVGANIIDIANSVKDIISRYDSKLPENIQFTTTTDQSEDIKRSVRNLENNILSGLILVLLILFTLLGLRNAFFVAIAIPLSMLISFIILSMLDITLNMIVLFSLILALGMLVDNAIVIIENIYKFLEDGNSLLNASKKGAKEVAWPITTSTLTTVTAFMPLLFWPGVVGDFMKYLPITLIVTLASSLFVALVINPVFASRFMKLQETGKKKGISGKIHRVTDYFNEKLLPRTMDSYERYLKKALGGERDNNKPVSGRTWIGIGVSFLFVILIVMLMQIPFIPNFLVLIGSVIAGYFIIMIFRNPRLRVLSGAVLALIIIILVYREFDHGVEFFPQTEPPRVYVNVEAPPGTNIEMSNYIVSKIEKRLRPFLDGDVSEIVANVGQSNDPFSGGGDTPDKSTITIQYVDYEDREESSLKTTEDIRRAVSDIAGAEIEVEKQQSGPPVGPPINVEIIGEDFYRLGELSGQVKSEIENIPGLVDLKDDYNAGRPELRVEIDREKAALFGLSTSSIANFIRTAINGVEASQYRVGEEDYDITVRLKKDQRQSLDAVQSLRINYNDKKGNALSVPLSSVANVKYDKGPGAIRRIDLKRVVTVTANVDAEYNANEVLAAVQKELSDFPLPPDYKIDYTGQNEEQQKAGVFLVRAFAIAFMGIFLIMVIQFNSLGQPMIIMAAVAISLLGVFIGLTIFGMAFGIIMTGIGIISLAGVVVNNNIVLIDYINILRAREYTAIEAAIAAGIRRFRPVTLTAATTILGLIPLTFGFGFDFTSFSFDSGGAEADFWRQMGVAVIFGLLFGTVLTLVIVPVMYTVTEDFPAAVKASFRKWFGKNKSPKK